MDDKEYRETISSSKEESIAKAIQMLQGGRSANVPLKRPQIPTGKTLLWFALWFAAAGGVLVALVWLGAFLRLPGYISYPVGIAGCLLILSIKAKALVRNFVLLYQKHAPEKMRRACLFEPSCSEYMLLAVEKYGVAVGVRKGVCRLCRCRHPNGGVDYP